jgi:hypothetical protein
MEDFKMNWMQKTTRLLAILALGIILVGCSTPTVVVPPTQDIPSIRTESAQTVVAKLTIEAALEPAATEPPAVQATPQIIVITATPEPNPTATPTTQSVAATATLIPTAKPVSGGAVYPTATRRAGPDQAQLISQSPKDGASFSAGAEFDGTWTFKNVGTSTWSVNYDYRFSDGTNLAKAKLYSVPKSVAPGESVTLATDMVAPAEAGRYTSYWELTNENGDVFYQFFLIIDVK